MAAGYCYFLGINSNAFFLKDNKKPFILGLNVPKVTAYHHSDAAYLHVVGVGDVDQSWAESLQVGTLLDDFSAQPELIVEFMSVAVEGSLACNGETIVMIGIDECCKIV